MHILKEQVQNMNKQLVKISRLNMKRLKKALINSNLMMNSFSTLNVNVTLVWAHE